MTPLRWFYFAFWAFLVVALAWQFINSTENQNQAVIDHPKTHKKYYFYTPVLPSNSSNPNEKKVDAPILRQTTCTVENDVPMTGQFTMHVAVKNIGTAKATHIQMGVRPYLGTRPDESQDDTATKGVSVTDALGQIQQWIPIPDLAPGETSPPQSAVFSTMAGVHTGGNPHAEFTFDTEKPSAKP